MRIRVARVHLVLGIEGTVLTLLRHVLAAGELLRVVQVLAARESQALAVLPLHAGVRHLFLVA
jgi:hypothetical protein